MNQLNRTGSSASSSTRSPSSPTYNGYAHFTKFKIPKLSSPAKFVKPYHMQDPEYLAHHANKPHTDNKAIALNDLEEPVKLTILSDIERDQRLQAFKQSLDVTFEKTAAKIEDIERKRKADQDSFNRFVTASGGKLSDLQSKYNELYERHTKLQKKYGELIERDQDNEISINGYVIENSRLKTLIATKDQEIADMNETIQLYTPQSPPDVAALANIMDPPALDLKRSAVNDFYDYSYSKNPFMDLDQDDQPSCVYPSDKLAQTQSRIYAKKASNVVTDPKILYALKLMASSVYTYSRDPFKGVDINGVRYAFYFGKISTGGVVGMSTNIVLSSDKKVFNISNIEQPIELNWNQDRFAKGKRGFGHIYLGKLTGERGFETNLKDVFTNELGVNI